MNRKLIQTVKREGLWKILRRAYCSAIFGLRHNLPLKRPTRIFDHEWELLIVLDACRPDLLAEVTPIYPFLPQDVETVWSGASESIAWLQEQFAERYRKEMAQTAYIVGNPFSDQYLNTTDFYLLDEVWHYGWDHDVGGMPARPLTDRAIAVGRNLSPDRLIVHYMQPHFPSFPEPLGSEQPLDQWGERWNSIWDELEAGNVDRETVWRSYQANLEYVLNDVELLLSNIDVRTAVITADHGNCFGECGLYGHPHNYPATPLRRVPWVQVEASDKGTYEPELERESVDTRDETIDHRLRDLGYRR